MAITGSRCSSIFRATSVRDLVIHGDDLVVGTHGRGFWILDDISPLRQINTAAPANACAAVQAASRYRVRRNQNTDTPLPPEEPAGQNPPDGAIVNYWLQADASSPITIEVLDAAGKLVRRYSSNDPADAPETDLNVPTYWIRPQRLPSTKAGMQRFIWDLRSAPPDALAHEYPISAIYGDTPREPLGVLVQPGQYQVRLTANGQTYNQPLTVKMDPRVKTPAAGLAAQFHYATLLQSMMHQTKVALDDLKTMSDNKSAPEDQVAELRGVGRRRGAPAAGDNFTSVNGDLSTVYNLIESSDSAPTSQAVAAVATLQGTLKRLQSRLATLKTAH